MTPSQIKDWRVSLNIMGLGLFLVLGQDFLTRIAEIKYIPLKMGPEIIDGGCCFFASAAFLILLITAFSSKGAQRDQIPWIHRSIVFYISGLIFLLIYIALVASVSPYLWGWLARQ